MQVSLLFQRATTHGLQSRRRSWKNAQEIIKTTCPTVVPTTVHGAVQRLTARHGGEGDGKGEGEGEGDGEGDGDGDGDGDDLGANYDVVDSGNVGNVGSGRADTMTLGEWVAALVRLAWHCIPHAITIGARLSKLLEDFVVPGTLQGLRAAGLTAG